MKILLLQAFVYVSIINTLLFINKYVFLPIKINVTTLVTLRDLFLCCEA